jgi:predicted MFS family arabinose efflux permease
MVQQAMTEDRGIDEAFYPWVLVGLLWCVCFLNYADRQAIFSVFTPLKREFHLSDLRLAMLATAFIWVYALSGPATGWVADHASRKRIIIVALAFWSAITAAVSVAPGFRTLVSLRALSGLGEAFYFPAAMSLLESYHPDLTRSRAMAIHQSAVYVGVIAGGTLSAYIAERTGWRSSFNFFGMAGLGLALLLIFLLREPGQRIATRVPAETASLGGGIAAVFRNGPAMTLIASFVGSNFVAVVFLTWLPTYLERRFHLSLTNSGFTSTIYLQASSIAGVLLGGVLTDRLRIRYIAARQRMQCLGMACGVPFLFLVGWSRTPSMFALCTIGFGFFKGIYDANLWASLYDVVPLHQKGISVGLMNSIGWLGGGIAPLAIAAASAHVPLSACLSMTSVLYGCNAILLFSLARWREKASLEV